MISRVTNPDFCTDLVDNYKMRVALQEMSWIDSSNGINRTLNSMQLKESVVAAVMRRIESMHSISPRLPSISRAVY